MDHLAVLGEIFQITAHPAELPDVPWDDPDLEKKVNGYMDLFRMELWDKTLPLEKLDARDILARIFDTVVLLVGKYAHYQVYYVDTYFQFGTSIWVYVMEKGYNEWGPIRDGSGDGSGDGSSWN